MHDSLVSIIIPNFNRAELICETLQSLRNQTYQNWEAIIVDDGSVDDSDAVINNLIQIDSRFIFLKRNRLPKGAPTCRNIGIENATGQYLIFLDSDDLLSKTCLEGRVGCMDAHKELDFAVFPIQLFKQKAGDDAQIWLHKDFDDALDGFLLRAQWSILNPIWRKESIDRLGGFREGLLSWQDWDLHVRALIAGLHFRVNSGTPDAFCRRGSHSRMSLTDKQIASLQSLIRLFVDITELLRLRNLLTAVRKKTLSGRFLLVSGKFYEAGEQTQAKDALAAAYKAGLLNKGEFALAWRYLVLVNHSALQKSTFGRKMLRKWFSLFISKYIIWSY